MVNEQDHTEKDPSVVNHCLQTIVGIQWMDKVSKKELWERTNKVQIEIDILKRRLGWIGHTLRKPNSNIIRQALTWNPHGKRKKGDQKTLGDVTLRQTPRKRS